MKTLSRMIEVCDRKIAQKGETVGISFYVFFANQNSNPEALFKVAKWWILEEKLDHFERALKIKSLLQMLDSEKFD